MNIQNYLPHRYPFLLIDKVIDIKKNESITAQKNVSNNEPFFQGHFPDYPVFPGVLLLEAMAQATAILDIESNKRKLTTKALVSFSEREFLKNIIKKLSNQNLTNNHLIKLCNERMVHTKNWDVFMKLFNDIHPDFNKYIIKKAISISESELRVCNLIKMNFSTLETAEILAITIRGVEQHRYRIKKKLKLKTDLTVFLQSI